MIEQSLVNITEDKKYFFVKIEKVEECSWIHKTKKYIGIIDKIGISCFFYVEQTDECFNKFSESAFYGLELSKNDCNVIFHSMLFYMDDYGTYVNKKSMNDFVIKDLILNGKKINAIRQYRYCLGSGLKEAKDYVENMAEKLKR